MREDSLPPTPSFWARGVVYLQLVLDAVVDEVDDVLAEVDAGQVWRHPPL